MAMFAAINPPNVIFWAYLTTAFLGFKLLRPKHDFSQSCIKKLLSAAYSAALLPLLFAAVIIWMLKSFEENTLSSSSKVTQTIFLLASNCSEDLLDRLDPVGGDNRPG